MNIIEEIQSGIERLSARDRATILAWMQTELLVSDSFVGEPLAAYDWDREPRRMTVEEYLDFEDPTGLGYEYVGGEIFAMTGASVRHGTIIENLANAFHDHLRGGPCRSYASGVKVRMKVNDDDVFYCPDVLVVCGPINNDGKYLPDPKLIVEVISPSTEYTDRREKALHYRNIASLEEFVLIAQKRHEVTIYRRSEEWRSEVLTAAESVAECRSVGLSLPLKVIYDGAL